jgi:glycerol-3-phosphate dehydrogenase (NAD(P)+)
MSEHFAILGDGAWGTAVALLLAGRPGRRITLWSARPESGRRLRETRVNPLLPGVPIPPEIELTADPAAANGAALIIIAIPTAYLRPTLTRVASSLGRPRAVVSLTKGLEAETFQRPSQVIGELLGTEAVAVLSGPSHAEEVSRGLPTSVVAASREPSLARQVQGIFSTDRFRVYTNPDPVGVELAGALKNVIGIAAGISDGLEFGDNTKAALLTRGLVEMTRFGVALGAQAETFQGLAGMGDLITTCVSRHGRNRRVGERLGRGEALEAILGSMPMVAEGVYSARSIRARARQLGLELPITEAVHRVLYEGQEPREAVVDLMTRTPKDELADGQRR